MLPSSKFEEINVNIDKSSTYILPKLSGGRPFSYKWFTPDPLSTVHDPGSEYDNLFDPSATGSAGRYETIDNGTPGLIVVNLNGTKTLAYIELYHYLPHIHNTNIEVYMTSTPSATPPAGDLVGTCAGGATPDEVIGDGTYHSGEYLVIKRTINDHLTFDYVKPVFAEQKLIPRLTDCGEVYRFGRKATAVYQMDATGSRGVWGYKAVCEDGWTEILRRDPESSSGGYFDKTINKYKDGFYSTAEYFIGTDVVAT